MNILKLVPLDGERPEEVPGLRQQHVMDIEGLPLRLVFQEWDEGKAPITSTSSLSCPGRCFTFYLVNPTNDDAYFPCPDHLSGPLSPLEVERAFWGEAERERPAARGHRHQS